MTSTVDHYEPRDGDRVRITYPPGRDYRGQPATFAYEGIVQRDYMDIPGFCLNGTDLRTGRSIALWFDTDATAGREQTTTLITPAEGAHDA